MLETVLGRRGGYGGDRRVARHDRRREPFVRQPERAARLCSHPCHHHAAAATARRWRWRHPTRCCRRHRRQPDLPAWHSSGCVCSSGHCRAGRPCGGSTARAAIDFLSAIATAATAIATAVTAIVTTVTAASATAAASSASLSSCGLARIASRPATDDQPSDPSTSSNSSDGRAAAAPHSSGRAT